MHQPEKRKQRMKIILVGVLIAIVVFMLISEESESDWASSSLITDDSTLGSSCPFAGSMESSTAFTPQTESFIIRPSNRW